MHNMSSTYSAVSWGTGSKNGTALGTSWGSYGSLKKNRGWHDGIAPVMSEISLLKIWVWIGLNDVYIGFLWVCLGFHPLANLDAHPSMLRRVRILGYQQAGLEPTLCWKTASAKWRKTCCFKRLALWTHHNLSVDIILPGKMKEIFRSTNIHQYDITVDLRYLPKIYFLAGS